MFLTTVHRMKQLAQEWERLLYSTGGAFDLLKSFWFAMSWKWKGGTAHLETISQRPGDLTMTCGSDPTQITVPRVEPTSTYRTLGVFLSPSDNVEEAYFILKGQMESYASYLIGSSLTRGEAYWSYVLFLLAKLCYQLPCIFLSQSLCDSLMLHVNRNTARSIIFGPEELGGMNLPHLFTYQRYIKLSMFLGHIRVNDKTGKLLRIGISHLQLISGSRTFVLNTPYQPYSSWITNGWLLSLWEFTASTGLTFKIKANWLPKLTREKDSFLTEQFVSITKTPSVLKTLNQCRLYLQVITVSDITSACGAYILPEIKEGKLNGRRSTLKWPIQGHPTKTDWTIWSNHLTFLETGQQLKNAPWKMDFPNALSLGYVLLATG
jgi:hypothetical protein